jgi:hypothetical protein
LLKTYNFTGTLDCLALTDQTIGTEKHNTDLAGLEVHAHALDARGEPVPLSVHQSKWRKSRIYALDKLFSLDIGKTVHTGDTVTEIPLVSS